MVFITFPPLTLSFVLLITKDGPYVRSAGNPAADIGFCRISGRLDIQYAEETSYQAKLSIYKIVLENFNSTVLFWKLTYKQKIWVLPGIRPGRSQIYGSGLYVAGVSGIRPKNLIRSIPTNHPKNLKKKNK